MFTTLIFAGLAILLVVAVLVRNMRARDTLDGPVPPGAAGASRTPSGSDARRERKRRRAQSRHDRRKRH